MIARVFAAALLIASIGCAPVGGRRDEKPAPLDRPSAANLAATDLVKGIASGFAQEADQTVAKAGDYKTWDEAFTDWGKRNKAAKSSKLAAFVKAVDEATGDDEEYSASLLREAAQEAAKGFREAAGEQAK